MAENAITNLSYIAFHRPEVGIGVIVAKGKSYGGDTFHGTLESYADSAAVVSIYRGVVAMVYTAEDKVGRSWTENVTRHLDTVYRSAGTGCPALTVSLPNVAERQRPHAESP